MHSNTWKQDERDIARWAGGQRHPSAGVEQQDLSGPWWTAEHKSFTALPARIVKAFDQAAGNRAAHPDKEAYVVITLHPGRGKGRIRRFLAVEVDLAADDFDTVAHHLRDAAASDTLRGGGNGS
jgi:hypothetical protein